MGAHGVEEKSWKAEDQSRGNQEDRHLIVLCINLGTALYFLQGGAYANLGICYGCQATPAAFC